MPHEVAVVVVLVAIAQQQDLLFLLAPQLQLLLVQVEMEQAHKVLLEAMALIQSSPASHLLVAVVVAHTTIVALSLLAVQAVVLFKVEAGMQEAVHLDKVIEAELGLVMNLEVVAAHLQ
jgi:hypothetical protein